MVRTSLLLLAACLLLSTPASAEDECYPTCIGGVPDCPDLCIGPVNPPQINIGPDPPSGCRPYC